jgi:hypothetical protein
MAIIPSYHNAFEEKKGYILKIMSPKKLHKLTKKDKGWQQKIEKRLETEKGKERFDLVIQHLKKKKH